MGDLHLLFLASFPGALRTGSKTGLTHREERFNPLRGMCLRRWLTHLRSGTGCTSGLPRDRRLPTNLADASLHAYLGNVVESKRKQCPESNPFDIPCVRGKLIDAASKTWRRLKGTNQLSKIVADVRFADGIEVVQTKQSHAA